MIVRLFIEVDLPPGDAAFRQLQADIHNQPPVQIVPLQPLGNHYYGRLVGATETHT